MADDTSNLPAVVAAPGVVANDGHEHFWSPRNIIAFAVLALFAFSVGAPYYLDFPKEVQAVNMLMNGTKTAENIMILVLGFYFGTTVNASRTAARAENNAAAAGAAAALAIPPSEPRGAPLELKPPFTLHAEEPTDGPEADARRPAAEPAGLPAPVRLQPGDGGPPE